MKIVFIFLMYLLNDFIADIFGSDQQKEKTSIVFEFVNQCLTLIFVSKNRLDYVHFSIPHNINANLYL